MDRNAAVEVGRRTGEGAGVLVEKVLAAAGVDSDAARVRHATERYLAHYAAFPCVFSTLFADAATALPALKRAGVRLAVCTNKPERLAATVLRALDLEALMDAVVGADTTAARKPDPLPLRHTLALLGVAAPDALYIGDTAIETKIAAWRDRLASALASAKNG